MEILFLFGGAFIIGFILKSLLSTLKFEQISNFIEDEYPTTWFTVEMLCTQGRFNETDCLQAVLSLLLYEDLLSRDADSKVSCDISDVVHLENDEYSWDRSELLHFLRTSEFLPVNKPSRRRKSKKETAWDNLLPVGLRPKFT